MNIGDAVHKVRAGKLAWPEAQKRLATARQIIQEKWAAHPTDDLVGEEKKLVVGIERAFEKLDIELVELNTLLETQNREALNEFSEDRLFPEIDNVVGQLNLFMEAQLTEADHEFAEAQGAYEFNRNIILVKGQVVFEGSSQILLDDPSVLEQHLGV